MGLASSLSSVIGVKTTAEPITAGLAAWDPVQRAQDGDVKAFQYFPENITDNRSPNYSSRDIPGGSHPIHTFISGGEREISFSAIFTADKAPPVKNQGLLGSAASLLSGKTNRGLSDLVGSKDRRDVVDVSAAIAWLRQFTYPSYDDGIMSAPPPVIIYLPNSGIVSQDNEHAIDSIICLMTACNVTYQLMHRDGTPRIVVVQLSFKETVQIGKDWKFYGSSVLKAKAGNYKRAMVKP